MPIETGRYEQKPREERFCNLGCNKIGDEQHFLFECQHPFMKEERILFMNQLHYTFPYLIQMNNKDKLEILNKSSLCNIQCSFGKYSYNVLKIFKELTI